VYNKSWTLIYWTVLKCLIFCKSLWCQWMYLCSVYSKCTAVS